MTTTVEKTAESQTTQTPVVEKQADSKPDFGNGRYSNLMSEVWNSSKTVFKLSSEKAEKLARQIASDIGAIMAVSPITVKLGKINDDSKLTISEASKVKNVTLTNSVFALKALHFAGEAQKNGFSYANTGWKPGIELAKYLATL